MSLDEAYTTRLLEKIKRLNQENRNQTELITALEEKVKLLELRIKLLKQKHQPVS